MKTLILNDNTTNLFNSIYTPDDNYTLIIKSGEPIGLFTAFSNSTLRT